MSLSTFDIFIRLFLSVIFSGLIGFEREKSNSNAGIKTHILVGMGATIVALIQVETINIVQSYSPDSRVSLDAVRLISQVISGVGFLGAGTIIVTKRNVFGLTTAASIWGIASIGVALGMGFYRIALIGVLLILVTLLFFKRIWVFDGVDFLLVKYIAKEGTFDMIISGFENLGLNHTTIRWSTTPFGHDLITTHVFKIEAHTRYSFDDIVKELSQLSNIISIETSTIG